MKLLLHLICIVAFIQISTHTKAQISTTPSVPFDDELVTVTFNAAEGNMGLKDYTGDIYAHTGIITDKSSSNTDWKYVKANWGENKPECKLTSIGDNKYTLQMSPSIREYYGVPADEKIEKMKFVFRAHDNSKEGKTSSGTDISVEVSTKTLTVNISKPIASNIYSPDVAIPVNITATNAASIKLFLNDEEVSSNPGNEFNTDVTIQTPGKHTIKAQAINGNKIVSQTITVFVRDAVVEEKMPQGLKRGVNIINDNSINFVLFAPQKKFVHVIGSFNDWMPSNQYQMKKDGDYFWYTLTDLNDTEEYAFQFFIDGEIRVADPYTNKTLDPDDKNISTETYPNLMDYPTGLTEHVASVFTTKQNSFNWTVSDFTPPEANKLVIYELLIRDFSDAKNIKTVTDSIKYFKELGISAIELMPINEFEGNNSWGYNPSFYFAPDKAYGTDNDYKEFVDECHKNGIAVLLDLTLNHSFGQSPLVRMYFEDGKPAANNPWYNRDGNIENSDLNWGYDFNHESTHTKELVDSICSFWMSEYKVDGFRFDFTKGFSNTPFTKAEDKWANGYDDARIANLKRMADEVWKRKSNAIVAFEHLADNSEEKELANHGILLWGNHNHNFNEATMGYHSNGGSNFSWASYKNREWDNAHIISYMESHDEERLMFKNKSYGAENGEYSVKNINTGLKRTATAAVFLISIPGPKMIWQFGELGYDYSINTCEDLSVNNNGGCRTAPKPVVWNYMEDENRRNLYETYKSIIELKKKEPVFSTNDFTMDVASSVKSMELNYADSDVRLVGNFDTEEKEVKPKFSETGYWYNHFKGNKILVEDIEMTVNLKPGEFALFSQKELYGFNMNTSVGDGNYFENVKISPNPARGFVTISNGGKPMKEVKITNVYGKQVYKGEFTEEKHVVNLENFARGVYLVNIIGNNHKYRTSKLLVK